MTIAAPVSRMTSPPETADSATAMEALDDWASAVIANPASRKRKSCRYPPVSASTGTRAAIPSKVSLRTDTPRKKRPNPAIASPSAPLAIPGNSSRTPMPMLISGKARNSIFTLKPMVATIQPVIVVPTLLPKITQTA